MTRAMLSDAMAAKYAFFQSLLVHRKDQFSAISLSPAAYQHNPYCETYIMFTH